MKLQRDDYNIVVLCRELMNDGQRSKALYLSTRATVLPAESTLGRP